MIEREATVKISCDLLVSLLGEGAKSGVKGRLVRIAEDGYYEVTLTLQNGSYTVLLPISALQSSRRRPSRPSLRSKWSARPRKERRNEWLVRSRSRSRDWGRLARPSPAQCCKRRA